MRLDQRADAVLELRDHLAAAVVRRRVGGEEDQHVDVELDRVAADLHVALFEDVEQADLHQLVQLRDLVHGEDAAVHARDQAEVQRLLGRHADAAGQLGRVDLADDVGELGARAPAVRRSAARAATRRSGTSSSGSSATSRLPAAGDRPIRILVDRQRRVVDVGNLVVEEADQRAHQPALGLALFAEEEQVVAGDQGEVDLGDDRVVVADDAGEQLVAALQHAQKVVANLLLDRFGNPAAVAQFFQVGRSHLGWHHAIISRSCPCVSIKNKHPFIVSVHGRLRLVSSSVTVRRTGRFCEPPLNRERMIGYIGK